jgi:hypothetical protein
MLMAIHLRLLIHEGASPSEVRKAMLDIKTQRR